MRQKIVVLIVYLVILNLLLNGCYNAQELDKLGISLVMGFDIVDGKILITAEVVDPSYSSNAINTEQGSTVKYVQGVGNTLFEALADITLKFDRSIYSAHNKVLIFGDEIAKNGLIMYIDQLFRDTEQRESAYMLIAKGGKAYEVMGVNNGLEQLPANYILQLIQNVKYNPKAVDTNIIQYMNHYYHEGHHPVVGVIEKKKKMVIDKTSGDNSSGSEYELSVLGSAIFKEDKLIGYLLGNDTKAINYLMNNIKGGIITFPIQPTSEGEGQSARIPQNISSINVIKGKTKNDVIFEKDKLVLKTKINIRASLGEVIGDVNISTEEDLRRIEQACEKVVEENIKSTVKQIQKEFGVDIFGFGIVFHHKYPKQWKEIEKNWDEIFSDADYQIEVNVKIIRTGLINEPAVK